MKEEFNAWAIRTRPEEGFGFIRRCWWFEFFLLKTPTCLEGCVVALFRTQKIARKNLASVRKGFPRAVPVKVKVTIETREKGKMNNIDDKYDGLIDV